MTIRCVTLAGRVTTQMTALFVSNNSSLYLFCTRTREVKIMSEEWEDLSRVLFGFTFYSHLSYVIGRQMNFFLFSFYSG